MDQSVSYDVLACIGICGPKKCWFVVLFSSLVVAVWGPLKQASSKQPQNLFERNPAKTRTTPRGAFGHDMAKLVGGNKPFDADQHEPAGWLQPKTTFLIESEHTLTELLQHSIADCKPMCDSWNTGWF